MSTFFKKLMAGEEGATMVEYALMVALIAAAAAAIVTTLGQTVNTKFAAVNTSISAS